MWRDACGVIAEQLQNGLREKSPSRDCVADVESFAENMFPHAPTCFGRHCCVSHRAWPVMFMQSVDDAKNCFFY